MPSPHAPGPSGGSTALTRRGWSLLGAAIGLLAAGRLLGAAELTVLGLTAGGLLGTCVIWTRSRTVPLGLRRELRPDRVHVGGEARVDLEVRAGAAAPQVTVTDAFDDGRRAARFIVPALERGQSARAAYRVPTDRRGRFRVGPAVVGIADPFGLTARAVTWSDGIAVIVRPRVHELREVVGAPGPWRAAVPNRARVPVPTAAPDEFLALRDYEVGDDLRRIHWRSTARLGDLVVRDDEAAWQPQTVVVLDNRAGAHRAGSYEAAIEALASIALRLGRAGRSLEILTTTGRHLGGAPGAVPRADALLDELALLGPDPDDSVAPAVRRLRAPARRGRLIVVTGAPADLTMFTGLAGPGAPVTIVVCADAAAAGSAHLTVVDGRPGHLVTSWDSQHAAGRARRGRRSVG